MKHFTESKILLSEISDNEEIHILAQSPCHPYGCNLTNTTFTSVQLDFVGAGTLGDIMSTPNKNQPDSLVETSKLPSNNDVMGKDINYEDTPSTPNHKLNNHKPSNFNSGLVTSTGGTLESQFSKKMNGYIPPLERIALTANGNLQRIFSSYYDAPVHVVVDRCQLRHNDNENAYETNKDDLPPVPAIWDRAVHLSVHDQNFCTAYSEITVYSQECIELVCSGKVGIGQIFRYLDKLPTFELMDAGRSHHGGMWREYLLSCDELTCQIREEFSSNAWQISPKE